MDVLESFTCTEGLNQVRATLSRVTLGVNRNTETERHSQGSPKRTGPPP